jgi:hypothetical protein
MFEASRSGRHQKWNGQAHVSRGRDAVLMTLVPGDHNGSNNDYARLLFKSELLLFKMFIPTFEPPVWAYEIAALISSM